MSFLKYLSEAGQAHVARTPDGFPIRGNQVPFLKQDEYENIQLGTDAHVRVFATWKPDDMRDLTEVLDKIANTLFYRLADDREEFVASEGGWLILMRWGEIKGEFSPGFMDAVGGYRR